MSDFNRISIRSDPAKSNYDDGVSGLSLDDVRPSTVLVSAKLEPKGPVTEPLVIPIYHSSTYVVKEMEDCLDGLKEGAPIYSRLANPTTETAEAVINGLERGAGSLTFSSGMAAITSVMLGFLKSGDHVIHQIPVYPGTLTALKFLNSSYGVELTAVKDISVEAVSKHIKDNTKMLWIETPCNPDIYVVDVEGLTQLAKSKNILVAVDGTFGSPALQHFMPLGIDFSVHSSTKYMGGHSDLIGGCVTTRTVEQWRILKLIQGTFGNMLSPHDASLLLRGLKTLSLRMERISENAMKVATYLEQHPKVQRVRYPGLTSHPQHEVARKQMTSYSGMIMAEIKGGEKGGRAVAENVRIVRLAVSLGGVESLVEHPYTMTHGKYLMTEKEMEEACITPGMLRISIGLEDADDLIKDFGQALEKLEL
ncbi:cystathionine gamma-lyase-like isoform X1 [Physella acuta]|uniref:cystathionine gamma-lyase-like isoform X1 n=1 Tax=Physella acuta TaxID=109671 RepID=UPI0027DB9130|nr:cystathionine gamma-lyase-like isoform X1 [Physella acuta]